MTEATAVDTATGQIEADDVILNSTTDFIKGGRQVFRRRYSHYIDTNTNEGASTERLTFIGTTSAREFADGSASIPYQNLGIAMSPAQYCMFTAGANMVKVHGMGFDIQKITILQENLTTRSGGTILENTFQSRPSVLLFTDARHMWDEVVGVSGLTTVGSSTGVNTGNPRLMRSLISLPTLATAMNVDSAIGSLSFTYPASQADGMMPKVSWYMLNGQTELSSARMFLDDTMNPKVLGETKKHSFIWQNPSPQWHRSGSYPYNGVAASNAATPLANKASGYWPSSRADALGLFYHGSLLDQTTDNAYDSTGAAVATARRAGLDTKGNHDLNIHTSPPYCYVKIPPLWGPTGRLNFVAELWIEYWVDLEWTSIGLLPFSQNFWPANASITNASFSSTTGLVDLRRTFGAAQGQQLIGSKHDDEDETDGQPTVRRPRFAGF